MQQKKKQRTALFLQLGNRHQKDGHVHDNIERRAHVRLGRHVDAVTRMALVPHGPDELKGHAVRQQGDDEDDGEADEQGEHAVARLAEVLGRKNAQVQHHDGRLGQGALDHVGELGNVEEDEDGCDVEVVEFPLVLSEAKVDHFLGGGG